MDGLVIVNKPKDYTSRDVVNVVGKTLKTKQIGHTGTLDPMATGVLVVCVGKATKIAELLTSETKEYEVEMELGFETDTLDLEGKITKEGRVPNINEEQLAEVLNSFVGEQKQEVPIYSAVKVNGRKLYEYARNNEEVKLPIKDIIIFNIELISLKGNKIKFKTKVSKGTYIRSLVRDIALKLNTFGTMTYLNRTKQGKFDIKEANDLNNIKDNNYKLISILEALDLPKIKVNDEMAIKIRNGQILDRFFDNDNALIVDNEENLIAIYKTYEKDNKKVKPYKMF